MLVSLVAALALFAAPETTQASGSAPEAQPAADAAVQAKPKKVCRKQPEVSGSRLVRKVCVTETPKAEKPAEASNPTAEKPAA